MEIKQDKRKITAPINGKLGGRPNGIPASVLEHKRAITEYLAKYIADNIVPMVEDMRKEVHAGNVMAFVALLDRAYGKVPQGIVPTDKNGEPIVFLPLELIEKHNLNTTQQTSDNVKIHDVKHIDVPK